MHPILFKLGPLTIHSYGFFMALGVAFGIWFLYRQARRQGLDAPRLIDAAFYIMIVSLVGAKLILFVGNFSYYLANPKELLWIARSGGVFQGGLAFGVLFALWYFRKYKLPTWKIADIAAPALALGHGFGRIGCFLAGCCYGRACALPWAANFQDEYAHSLTGVPIRPGPPSRPALRVDPEFRQRPRPLSPSPQKKIRRPGLFLLHDQLLRHPVFHRIVPGRPCLERLSASKGPSALLSLSVSQVFCLVAFAAGLILLRVFKKRSRG